MHTFQAIPYVPGRARGPLCFGLRSQVQDSVVVVPGSEIRHLRGRPAAIIAVDAAPLSHFMIRLLGAAIPTVITGPEQAALLREGERIAVDGTNGVVCDPDLLSDEDSEPPSPPRAGVPVMTEDGIAVTLNASISGADGAALALANGATAIGLVRSEYLTPASGSPPDTAFFEAAFRQLFNAAGSLPVRVRLLDLAPDKMPEWYRDAPRDRNALGLHGSRLFDTPSVHPVIEAQVTALAHIPEPDRLSLLLPAITEAAEFDRLREMVAQWLPQTLPIGAMAETPAAVLSLTELLERAPFAAVGCNDLMQHLFAADRDLSAVAHLIDPYAPPLHRFLRAAVQSAAGVLERVQFCGLLPQLPGVLPLLIGLGGRQFSVEPVLLPWLATAVRSTRMGYATALANAVCDAPESGAVRRLLKLENVPEHPCEGL